MDIDSKLKAEQPDILERLEDALQDLQTQAKTMSMLILSEAQLTRERDEAREFAIAVLRETRKCTCDFHHEPHSFTEACSAPWETLDNVTQEERQKLINILGEDDGTEQE